MSKDTISRITEKVAGELAEWSSRPLDAALSRDRTVPRHGGDRRMRLTFTLARYS
nr:hypothetical protein [Leifsonia xyli]